MHDLNVQAFHVLGNYFEDFLALLSFNVDQNLPSRETSSAKRLRVKFVPKFGAK